MKSFRRLLGFVALSAGVSLLYLGLSTSNLRLTFAGILSSAWGIWASIERLVCPRCGKRTWASSKGITPCQACGASYDRDQESLPLD